MRIFSLFFLFLCLFCETSYSNSFVENPRCIEYLDGKIVGLHKDNNKIGFVQLGGEYGSIGMAFIDDILGDDTHLYVGMVLPHRNHLCFAYYGGHQVVKKKDGTQCWLRAYIITGKKLLPDYLRSLDETLIMPLTQAQQIERDYEFCGSDWSGIEMQFSSETNNAKSQKVSDDGFGGIALVAIIFCIWLYRYLSKQEKQEEQEVKERIERENRKLLNELLKEKQANKHNEK